MAPVYCRQGSEYQGSERQGGGTRHRLTELPGAATRSGSNAAGPQAAGQAEAVPALVRLAVRRLDSVPLSGADSLGDAVQARARGFHRQLDRSRFLAGRLAARSFVASLLEVPETTVTGSAHCPDPACRYGNDGSHGEPRYFRNGQPVPLLVSFSRCGDWLAAAAAEIRRGDDPGVHCLGVDVEDAASPAFAGAGVEDVMATGAERAAIAAVAESARPRLRAQLWVRKEAVLKAAGQGLRIDPGSVDTLSGHQAGPRAYDVGPEKLGLPPNLVLSCAVGVGNGISRDSGKSAAGSTGTGVPMAVRLEFNASADSGTLHFLPPYSVPGP